MKLDNIFQQPGNHFDQLSTVLTHMYKYRNYTLGVFVPEAMPRDTNYTMGIIPIWYFNKEHILNARRVIEGILSIKKCNFLSCNIPQKYQIYIWYLWGILQYKKVYF